METIPWWASSGFWKKTAIWVTASALVLLIALTFDSMARMAAGNGRVPDYAVVNRHLDYQYDQRKHRYMPVIGGEAPLFGRMLSAAEAERLVTLGKQTVQAKNCMNCHTLLGNGAYYAPDLTRAWLDPAWGAESTRAQLMKLFLLDPVAYARTYGSGRRMPNLGLTAEEAEAVVAFLKWMAAIDTNGFPPNFRTLED